MTKTARILLRIEPELLERFDRLVEMLPGDVKRTHHIRQAMADYVVRWEPVVGAMNGSTPSSMVAPNGAFVDTP